MNGNQGLSLIYPVGPGKLAGLQGRMWERHQQELLMKPSREEKDAGLEGKTSVWGKNWSSNAVVLHRGEPETGTEAGSVLFVVDI